MNTLGERIREAREKEGYTQTQLGEAVGVSGAVISNWEKDLNRPDVEKVVRLCEVLKTPCACLLDCWVKESQFSLKEWELIRKYRLLDLHGKKITGAVLDEEYDRMTHWDTGKVERKDNMSYLRYFDFAVSAGTGEPLGEAYGLQRMSFPTERVPEDAHYCVRVNGNSMEPAYKDGDIVFVQRIEGFVQEGEIGIFVLNGEGYMKRLGRRELISLNPEYAPISIHDYDDLRCQGRVLGKL